MCCSAGERSAAFSTLFSRLRVCGQFSSPSFSYVSKVSFAPLSSFLFKVIFCAHSISIVVGSSAALVMVRLCLLGIKDKSFLLLSPHLPIRVHPGILIMSLTLVVSASGLWACLVFWKNEGCSLRFFIPWGGNVRHAQSSRCRCLSRLRIWRIFSNTIRLREVKPPTLADG